MHSPAEYIQEEDLNTIAELMASAFREDLKEEAFNDFSLALKPAYLYQPIALVCRDDKGEISAAGMLAPEIFASEVFSVAWVAAKESGTGAGKHLMLEMERIILDGLTKSGSATIILSSSTNPEYYKNLGYKKLGESHKNRPLMVKIISK